ncbi:MAG: Asp-tRNA(Asn)/Glu-tRNA(Gln) amidotransferase GatCAB subunit A [Planctomycetaceae bacterium]|jgi:aspartyl-tRNA(Asn)/glutamyl-tRNA(Gln) amidotransferase subunit A|nr:Asp-tRNA(Asn)/Glu-tRNA(Gln) amidotransferase GatCAB subunit A [Planctomycetaceae bacterium]MDP7274151.1 Asp-tRNA(Asn)/Glu-tRNA(Gln) amidotransferase subunit GatA [Planctomycetaceae bacterium]
MATALESSATLLDQLTDGQTTSLRLTQDCLDRIAAHDTAIGAFLHVDSEPALAAAAAIDRRREAGEPLGLLAGLPVAVKDVLATRGQPTTCASRMLQGWVPPYDAHVVERLRRADAVLIGKTNMDEFAMGSTTENSAFGPTRTPWRLDCAAGGSSGGSAAAVAAGMAPLAVGSDTGGSIRQPASFCGVVGLKPTYGRVSRYGLVAFASSLDQVGPFSGDVRGAALLLEVLADHDPRDATCADEPVPAYRDQLERPLDALRVGICRDHFTEGLDKDVDEAVEAAIDVYRRLGAEIHDIQLPHARFAVACYYLVAPSEASSNLARYDGVHYGARSDDYDGLVDMYCRSRGEAFGAEVKRRIMLGTYALSAGYYDAFYLKAQKVRRLIQQDYQQAFTSVDVIASPVAPTPAIPLGSLVSDPLQMYLADTYTISANLAGLPGLSLPAGFSDDGRPIGLQLLAPPFQESRLLQAAAMHERETQWHLRRPPLAEDSS